jgi:hypothetical protein
VFNTLLQSFVTAVDAQRDFAIRHGTNIQMDVGSWYLSPGSIETFWDTCKDEAKKDSDTLRAAHHHRLISAVVAEEMSIEGLQMLANR